MSFTTKYVKRKRSAPTSASSKETSKFMSVRPATIKNKMKRMQIHARQKQEKTRRKREEREKRQREAEALGQEPAKRQKKTLDNMREKDETLVEEDDEEVKNDEAMDEFSPYFSGDKIPKILITTCYHPTKMMYDFIKDLLRVIPGSMYYERKKFPLKKIVEAANKREFTDIMVINEDRKKFNALTHIHLPDGPTAHYKLTSVVMSKDIKGHGRSGLGKPEVILNNFNTRLGHRVGRMLASTFHQQPHFKARRVVTFHNQRDFIFFRHHRYVFDINEDKASARLQEIGPRFTLKLKSLQKGTFDTKYGEYEWIHKTDMDTSRRRFFL